MLGKVIRKHNRSVYDVSEFRTTLTPVLYATHYFSAYFQFNCNSYDKITIVIRSFLSKIL